MGMPEMPKILPSKSDSPTRVVRLRWPGLLLFAAGIFVTVLLARHAHRDALAVSQREFGFAGQEIGLKVQERLHAHEHILRSGAGLFAVVDTLTRLQWRAYVQSLQIEKHWPGIQGVGFARLVPRGELAGHLEEVRRDGFPAYRVWPEDDREVYSAIEFLEPFTNRNLRAFGYDMLTEPTRRVAMERARDEGVAALTARVKLVQETTTDVQAGTLMFFPVYRGGLPMGSVSERQAALRGWVYSPYRMNDLMEGILGGWDSSSGKRIQLRVFDGEELSSEALLYDSQSPRRVDSAAIEEETCKVPITYAGRRWTLILTRWGWPMGASELIGVWGVGCAGAALSLLLAGLLHSLLNTRYNARRLAVRLTADLQRTTERLAVATGAGGVGVWDYEVASGALIWDDQMFQLYGIERSGFSGAYDAWRAGLHPDDRDRADEEIRRALRGEGDFNTEFRVLHPDGTIRHLQAKARVQRDEKGQPIRVLGTNWDITVRKQAEEELLRTLASERELSALKSTFVSMVSHEFRTPLGAILGAAEMLEEFHDRLTPEKRVTYFHLIRQEVLRLTGMLQDVLLQGQLDAGRVLFKEGAVDVNAVCREVVARMQGAFPRHPPVEYVNTVPDVRTLGDESLLEHVLSNLLTNAFKYSPNFTAVGLEVRHVDGEWIIVVQDRGIGIPEADQLALFSAFHRGGNVGSVKGSGVGLYIVRKCVELQGGRVEVDSEVGRGTSITLFFPWRPVELRP